MMCVISPIDELAARSGRQELGAGIAMVGELGATFAASATSMREMDDFVGSPGDLFPYAARFVNPESEITYWGDNI